VTNNINWHKYIAYHSMIDELYDSHGTENIADLQGAPARAARAEATRRNVVTAIALERYHRQHGAYPASLNELVPQFLKTAPVDFMDGAPLRDRLTNGTFAVYSVGLDGGDH